MNEVNVMSTDEEVDVEKDDYEQSLSLWHQPSPNVAKWPQKSFDEVEMDLFTASSIGVFDCFKSALKVNDINKKNKESWTPLMYAVCNNHLDIVDFIISRGASIHVLNNKKQNALMIAAKYGKEYAVKKLLKAGSLLEVRDSADWTAVYHAIVYGDNNNVLQILLNHKANPNACVRHTGRTPLMLASASGNEAMVEMLLKHGANPDFTLFDLGKTAAELAKEKGFPKIASFIDDWKMNVLLAAQIKSHSFFNFSENCLSTSDCNRSILMDRTSNTSLTQPAPIYDLDSFLYSLGLEEYISLFKQQEVDLQVFLFLSTDGLKDCGVTKLGPRLKMSSAIKRWHDNAPILQGLESAFANKLLFDLEEGKSKIKELENNLMVTQRTLISTYEAKFEEIRKCYISAAHYLKAALKFIYPPNNQEVINRMMYASRFMDEAIQLTQENKSF